MEPKLEKTLDECLAMIAEGKNIDVCVSEHSDAGKELEPLLYTATFVSNMPGVQPSEEFRRLAKGRLMARLQRESAQANSGESTRKILPLHDLTAAASWMWQAFVGVRRVSVPVAISLVLLIVTLVGAANTLSPTPTLAAGCTLNIFSGTVEILKPEPGGNQPGADGMTLGTGTRVKTVQDSRASLTFFDGSTLMLEPGTDIEIKQLALSQDHNVTIVLKQWVGMTWSRVVKMADAGSHYEIQTPSAVALVRGTLFLTEVDEVGATRVQTVQGLVSVKAQGEEVLLPPGQQTTVVPGASPSEPTTLSASGSEKIQGQAQEEQPANSSHQDSQPTQAQGQNEQPGNSQDTSNVQANVDSSSKNQDKSDNHKIDNSQRDNIGQDKKNNQDKGNGQGNSNNQGNGQDNSNNQGNGQDNSNNQNNGQDNSNNQGNGQDNGNRQNSGEPKNK